MDKIKYLNNNIENGIDYDFNKVLKIYKKCKSPEPYDRPERWLDLSAPWNLLLSERSVGKTTMYLMLGIILHHLYGTRIEYIRQTKEHIAPKNSRDLFNNVLNLDYIKILTAGEYNSITYEVKRWYLVQYDEDGKEVKRDPEPVCAMHSLDPGDVMAEKSTYNSPKGDWIIFDEFLSKIYKQDEFLLLTQMISTIRRQRYSVHILMLSNTISPYSKYFEELCISREIHRLQPGQMGTTETALGTKVHYAWLNLEGPVKEERKRANNWLFGFPGNKMLRSITGGGWEIRNYPHLPRPEVDEVRTCWTKDFFIKCFGRILQIEIYKSNVLGNYALIHEYFAEPAEDKSVYVIDTPARANEIYLPGMLPRAVDNIIWGLKRNGRWFYASNEVGGLVEELQKYIKN